jgi:hypothetical protein
MALVPSDSHTYTSPLATNDAGIESAGRMAAVLPIPHIFNSPTATDGAIQVNGDVTGQVHMGDNNYYLK